MTRQEWDSGMAKVLEMIRAWGRDGGEFAGNLLLQDVFHQYGKVGWHDACEELRAASKMREELNAKAGIVDHRRRKPVLR